MWIVCITSVRHVLTVNGYGGRQTKENEKSWCFKGWETLVNELIYFLQIYLQNENLAYYASRMKQQYTSPLGATLKSILLSSFQDRLLNSLYNI